MFILDFLTFISYKYIAVRAGVFRALKRGWASNFARSRFDHAIGDHFDQYHIRSASDRGTRLMVVQEMAEDSPCELTGHRECCRVLFAFKRHVCHMFRDALPDVCTLLCLQPHAGCCLGKLFWSTTACTMGKCSNVAGTKNSEDRCITAGRKTGSRLGFRGEG